MFSVKRQSHVLRHMMTLQLFGIPQSYNLENPQKSAQSTQLHEVSWIKERSREKSCEIQVFLFD